MRISSIQAWLGLDSRATPTVACRVTLTDGSIGECRAPSGASVSRHEAVEIRDPESGDYGVSGVSSAVASVNDEIAPELLGLDATEQADIDLRIRQIDGTPDLSRLGGNATLPVSIAVAIAAAAGKRQPLWLSQSDGTGLLPMPMINILSGGAHAGGIIDFQDFLVIPVSADSFSSALRMAWSVRAAAGRLAIDEGLEGHLIADEGGLGLRLASNRAALEFLTRAIASAGLVPGEEVGIAVDVAAGQLMGDDGQYVLESEQRKLTSVELVEMVTGWATEFPIVSVEDILHEDDWEGWEHATTILGDRLQLVGDDLFATNSDRLARGVQAHVANTVLVKPNQIGTLTDAKRVVDDARRAGYGTVLSARSGDTEDSWLADLAVGWATGQIKVGSTHRAERTAKWNRLLAIEAIAGRDAIPFAGVTALQRYPGVS